MVEAGPSSLTDSNNVMQSHCGCLPSSGRDEEINVDRVGLGDFNLCLCGQMLFLLYFTL